VNNRFTGTTSGVTFGGNWSSRPCKLSQVVDPSMKMLAIEEDTTAINDGEWWSDDMERGIARRTSLSVVHDKGREYGGGSLVDPHYTSRGRGNVVFADGRCDFIERKKLLRQGWIDPHHHGGPY
jgi:prepilin-type processing-associated H-X9-DG protein